MSKFVFGLLTVSLVASSAFANGRIVDAAAVNCGGAVSLIQLDNGLTRIVLERTGDSTCSTIKSAIAGVNSQLDTRSKRPVGKDFDARGSNVIPVAVNNQVVVLKTQQAAGGTVVQIQRTPEQEYLEKEAVRRQKAKNAANAAAVGTAVTVGTAVVIGEAVGSGER